MVASTKKSHSHRAKGKQTVAEKKSPVRTHAASTLSATINIDRRSNKDRRKASDSDHEQIAPMAVQHRAMERRVKVNRRRQIDPTTCERDYTPEEIEFMSAMDDYKRRNGRMFPTCSEVLEVIKSLGYGKIQKTESPTLPNIDLPIVSELNLTTVG
jgi:hypothetical protein